MFELNDTKTKGLPLLKPGMGNKLEERKKEDGRRDKEVASTQREKRKGRRKKSMHV